MWPQLQCQKHILLAVARGWQPARSLQRGLQRVAEEACVITASCPQTEQTDTESECEEAGPAAFEMPEEEGADSAGFSPAGMDSAWLAIHKAHKPVLLRAGWFTSWTVGAVRVASGVAIWCGRFMC